MVAADIEPTRAELYIRAYHALLDLAECDRDPTILCVLRLQWHLRRAVVRHWREMEQGRVRVVGR